MRKIQDSVAEILYADEEALYVLSERCLNLSAYAKHIQGEVEKRTMKEVLPSSIVVALSRIQKELRGVHPLVQNIELKNVSTKSPLSEIVFEKHTSLLSRLSSFYAQARTTGDDFLSIILSTNEITVICSERLRQDVLEHFKEKPRLVKNGLASVGLSFDEKYYELPNITYSLLRRIARQRIVLAETITTHTEIIFVFNKKHLGEVVRLFQDS